MWERALFHCLEEASLVCSESLSCLFTLAENIGVLVNYTIISMQRHSVITGVMQLHS